MCNIYNVYIFSVPPKCQCYISSASLSRTLNFHLATRGIRFTCSYFSCQNFSALAATHYLDNGNDIIKIYTFLNEYINAYFMKVINAAFIFFWESRVFTIYNMSTTSEYEFTSCVRSLDSFFAIHRCYFLLMK